MSSEHQSVPHYFVRSNAARVKQGRLPGSLRPEQTRSAGAQLINSPSKPTSSPGSLIPPTAYKISSPKISMRRTSPPTAGRSTLHLPHRIPIHGRLRHQRSAPLQESVTSSPSNIREPPPVDDPPIPVSSSTADGGSSTPEALPLEPANDTRDSPAPEAANDNADAEAQVGIQLCPVSPSVC